MDKFVDPPRTLYDEIGEQEHDAFVTIKSAEENIERDWQRMVDQLQHENASLIHSLHEAMEDIIKFKREKDDLIRMMKEQKEMHDTAQRHLIERINQLEKPKEINDRELDLIFQKNYLMMENRQLKESESRLLDYLDVQRPLLTQVSKWRSIVYAIMAVNRFTKSNKK
ncbi:hypothetical protein BCV72DRAFT_302959 [Rhizopus microsporus var. microsporus]|uniref:Uncharacterized protein n=2 Tax=Rhizopus microsporus TaxID=58291 RepID=A0A2G4T859_RHIZD|nr:uncharacterized protein RHIMIDRAFT_232646 [Rhizopus microsporus ATCC 52813]ORE09209.1 hypothetical protein BCV72DRAFT_302959 [Rhizopus microsporus var. microsporus]PHZ17212.1 hypothetical protein RHIMIDRAFT_232646 [Rhizopus microsporus ATCC 52813]